MSELPRIDMTAVNTAITPPLRVLQIVGNSVIGGAENHVLALVRALDPARYAVTVVCPRPGPLVTALKSAGVRVLLIDMVKPAPDDEYLPHLPALWELFGLMQRWRPHIVHSHLYPAHLHASLAGRLADVPALVTTAHTLIVRPGDRWLAGLTRNRIIAVSEAVKAGLVGVGVSPRDVRVITNGIEARYFADETETARKLRLQLGIDPDAPVIGTVARLSPEKGHRELLHIARQVLARRPHARFLVVGTGPLAEELRILATELGIGDCVIFTGARQDVTALNHVLDVFLLPSQEEALPLAVLEAMAARRPVVASAVGGVPEVVVEGQTGLLFRPDDREGFVHAIVTLIDQPERRAQFGIRGRQRVRSRFGVERMARETARYYDAMVAAGRGKSQAMPSPNRA